MPLGPSDDPERFEDFDACVAAISDGDTTEEEAKRICGEWENEKEENSQTMSFDAVENFSGTASLSDPLDDEPPYTIHGVAIGPGDVTRGKSDKKKKWPAETLREAASSLRGRELVRDHINSTKGVVGEVIDAKWKEGVGVLYEAELDDKDLAESIKFGRLGVSARIKHKHTDHLEKDEDTDAFIVDKAIFANLSVVTSGASPSNEVSLGEATALSAAELADEFDYDVVDEESEEMANGSDDDVGDDGDESETKSERQLTRITIIDDPL